MNIANTTKRSKSGLFLMELIILICFFAIAAVICMQLFATAHTLNRRSVGIQMAVLHAQNAAESFRAGNYIHSARFDENWNHMGLTELDSRYKMQVEKNQVENIAMADIRVIDNFSEIELHSLTVKRLVD